MSAPHTPFPIADFKRGMFAGKEPWLSPSNAFRELTNGRIYRGRLEKRHGYSYLSDLGIAHAALSGGGTGANWNAIYGPFTLDANGYLGTLIPASATFTWTNGGGGATLTAKLKYPSYPVAWDGSSPDIGIDVVDDTGTTVIGSYLTVNQSFNVTWNLHPGYTSAGANRGTMNFYEPVGKPVVGLGSFKDADGDENVIACDRGAIYVLNGATKVFEKDTSSYTLTGSDSDYFWMWPFDSFLMLTNGVDPVLKYTPGGSPTITTVATEFDSTSVGNDLDTCLMVVRMGSRAVFLNTTENGVKYPRRARWTVGGGAFEVHKADGQNFTDAPSDMGDIVTCEFIGERLFVGFESGWMELVDSQYQDNALVWRPTVSRFGAVSKLSSIRDSARILSRSMTGMQALFPDGQTPIDVDIPDFVRDQNATKRALCAGTRHELWREFLWTFARFGSDTPDRVLAAQYDQGDELSWSVYDMAFTVWGQYFGETTETIDQLPSIDIDDLDGTVDSLGAAEGVVRLIAGASDGRVYIFDGSHSDVLDDITMTAISQSLSPIPGQKSHLGWIDVYGTADAAVSLTISLLGNDELSIHKAVTVSMVPGQVTNNVYRRVLINRSAAFHRIRIDATSSSDFAIDAVIPWFRGAGRLKAFG